MDENAAGEDKYRVISKRESRMEREHLNSKCYLCEHGDTVGFGGVRRKYKEPIFHVFLRAARYYYLPLATPPFISLIRFIFNPPLVSYS